jgi:hypothetical protein
MDALELTGTLRLEKPEISATAGGDVVNASPDGPNPLSRR